MADKSPGERKSRQHCLVKRWRTQEADYVLQMAELLPLPIDIKSKLSKPSILRLSAAYIKAKQLEDALGGSIWANGETCKIMDGLGGFQLTMDGSGLILNVSDHVHTILGHYPYEMTGMSILDFLHPDDYKYFHHQLRRQKFSLAQNKHLFPAMSNGISCEIVVRFQYKIANKSNKVKQTGYVCLLLRGVMKAVRVATEEKKSSNWQNILIMACYPHCLLPNNEMGPFETSCVMRFDSKFRFTYFDDICLELFGPNGKEFLGTDVKELIHPVEVKEWFPHVENLLDQKGSMVLTYTGITKEGHLFQALSHETIVFGPKGERLFSVDVDYVIRRCKVRIKHWPEKRHFIFLVESYGLPGEDQIPIKSYLDDVVDLNSPPDNIIDDNRTDDEENSLLENTNTVNKYTPTDGPKQKKSSPEIHGETSRHLMEKGFINLLYENSDSIEPSSSQEELNSGMETSIESPSNLLAYPTPDETSCQSDPPVMETQLNLLHSPSTTATGSNLCDIHLEAGHNVGHYTHPITSDQPVMPMQSNNDWSANSNHVLLGHMNEVSRGNVRNDQCSNTRAGHNDFEYESPKYVNFNSQLFMGAGDFSLHREGTHLVSLPRELSFKGETWGHDTNTSAELPDDILEFITNPNYLPKYDLIG